MKIKEIKAMDANARKTKLGELKMELVKSYVPSQKNKRTKEIKKTIARIITLGKNDKKQANS